MRHTLALLALFTVVLGCRTAGAPPTLLKEDLEAGAAPRLCTAYRGNGPLIWTHFAATARLVEHYGLVEGVAGGSSGSIAAFFYESIYANPLLRECDGAACSDREAALRASFLLKSILGYVEDLGYTDEAIAIAQLVPLAAAGRKRGLDELVKNDLPAARRELLALLEMKELRDVINPEFVALLRDSGTPDYHVKEMWLHIAGLGNWDVPDNRIFFRPGVLDFRAVARKLGRVGSFYAGYGPYDKAGGAALLEACAAPSAGKPWRAAVALPGPGGKTCGEAFKSLLRTYRTKLLASESAFSSRIDDKVGMYLPALIPTALLEGAEASEAYKRSRKNFLEGRPVDFKVKFDDVKIGYYGRTADLARVKANARGYTDLKTSKFVALGEGTWLEALSYSPAEPGLTRLQEMSPTRVSASGWFELFPTPALKNIGCENVVYVHRKGEEVGYPLGVARELGMTEDEKKRLYDLDIRPHGSLALAIAESEGVWCSDWSGMKPEQPHAIFEQTYSDPMQGRGAFLMSGPSRYPNAKIDLAIRGCSVP